MQDKLTAYEIIQSNEDLLIKMHFKQYRLSEQACQRPKIY